MSNSEPSDEELMQNLKDGDSEALLHLFERYSGNAWTYLNKRVSSDHVDDLFQDSFVKIFEKRHKWNNQPFVMWFYVIMRNLVMDSYRRNKIEEKSMSEFFRRNDLNNDKNFEDILSDLPSDSSRLLTEYFREGWTYKELAKSNNSSEFSLRKRLSRAIKMLRNVGSDE